MACVDMGDGRGKRGGLGRYIYMGNGSRGTRRLGLVYVGDGGRGTRRLG